LLFRAPITTTVAPWGHKNATTAKSLPHVTHPQFPSNSLMFRAKVKRVCGAWRRKRGRWRCTAWALADPLRQKSVPVFSRFV